MKIKMEHLLRIEEAFLFFLSVYLFSHLGYRWWLFPLLLLLPDLGMLGYAVNSRIGAYIYNFVHHRAVAVSLYMAGGLAGIAVLQLIGIILFAHSAIDRVFHYGLKYPDRFKHTHLDTGGGA